MPVIVTLTRNSDGATRTIDQAESCCSDDETMFYMWTEGNYSCDCNRAIFFGDCDCEEDPCPHVCGETAYSAKVEWT